MITIYTGNTGQGKTYLLALTVLDLLHRNKHWYEKRKTSQRRLLATNMALNPNLVSYYKDYVKFWSDMEQLVALRDCDVIFDDMAAYLDSQRWSDTPMSVKRWLRLHEHYGVDIFGNAQDFLTIDPSVRRLTYNVFVVNKMFGSPRPTATKPKVKRIWGILAVNQINTEDFDKEKNKYKMEGMPRFKLIHRHICEVFDTNQDMEIAEYPPAHHIERTCNTCDKIIVKHV